MTQHTLFRSVLADVPVVIAFLTPLFLANWIASYFYDSLTLLEIPEGSNIIKEDTGSSALETVTFAVNILYLFPIACLIKISYKNRQSIKEIFLTLVQNVRGLFQCTISFKFCIKMIERFHQYCF